LAEDDHIPDKFLFPLSDVIGDLKIIVPASPEIDLIGVDIDYILGSLSVRKYFEDLPHDPDPAVR